MNPVPWMWRFATGWRRIAAKVNANAAAHQRLTYTEASIRYRFDGWGAVGFPPRLACNVKYFSESGEMIDLGRFTA